MIASNIISSADSEKVIKNGGIAFSQAIALNSMFQDRLIVYCASDDPLLMKFQTKLSVEH